MATLYPNQVHESFAIVATNLDNGAAAIKVYDQLGKVVVSKPALVENNKLMEQVALGSLPDAAYIVSVTDGGGNVVRIKFVKD